MIQEQDLNKTHDLQKIIKLIKIANKTILKIKIIIDDVKPKFKNQICDFKSRFINIWFNIAPKAAFFSFFFSEKAAFMYSFKLCDFTSN